MDLNFEFGNALWKAEEEEGSNQSEEGEESGSNDSSGQSSNREGSLNERN